MLRSATSMNGMARPYGAGRKPSETHRTFDHRAKDFRSGCDPLLQVDDARFAEALAIQQATERGYDPDATPVTAEELGLLAAHDPTDAHLTFELDEENAHLAATEIFGAAEDPEAGGAAVAALLDLVEADGRRSLLGWGPQTEREAAFWESLGTTLNYRERISVLDVPSVDPDLMTAWIDDRHERAADVELVRFVDRCPDEYLAAWTASRSAMSDAPTEDLDINDSEWDEEDIRDDEAGNIKLGYCVMHVLALSPDGDPCGHTSVRVNSHRPEVSGVGSRPKCGDGFATRSLVSPGSAPATRRAMTRCSRSTWRWAMSR
jgi:hypothetical protein